MRDRPRMTMAAALPPSGTIRSQQIFISSGVSSSCCDRTMLLMLNNETSLNRMAGHGLEAITPSIDYYAIASWRWRWIDWHLVGSPEHVELMAMDRKT